MSDECVVGVYESLKNVEQAVHALRRGEFPAGQISLVSAWHDVKPELVQELKMGDDSIRDAAIGAGLGGALGVIAGIGAMVVSGLGIVFLAGPIGGGLFGVTLGAFLGSFAGWGVHEHQIQHYEQCVRNGKLLVIAHGNPLEVDSASRILKETDAENVQIHAKSDSESPEILDV